MTINKITFILLTKSEFNKNHTILEINHKIIQIRIRRKSTKNGIQLRIDIHASKRVPAQN